MTASRLPHEPGTTNQFVAAKSPTTTPAPRSVASDDDRCRCYSIEAQSVSRLLPG